MQGNRSDEYDRMEFDVINQATGDWLGYLTVSMRTEGLLQTQIAFLQASTTEGSFQIDKPPDAASYTPYTCKNFGTTVFKLHS